MSWLPKKNIIVPVDFSASSIHAVDVALELVGSPADITAIYVAQPLHVAEPGMLWGTISDEERIKIATKALDKKFADDKYKGLRLQAVIGIPARRIAELAKESAADLIVIPSHGRSGVERMFLGSVTEKVLRLADCQVLVLRVENEEK